MVEVYKTYKILINNQLVRSESGRTYKILDKDGNFLANIVRSSKKDLRDAVRYAKNALKIWNKKSKHNKGLIIYRMAEELESRKNEIINELKKHNVDNALEEVNKSIDRLIHYAGWTDKYSHLLGTINTVNSAFINYSIPEYVGIVGCIIPSNPPLLSFISQVIPAIVAGNTVVSIINENPLPILSFAEIIMSSDLPPGVINILTQYKNELIDHLVKHMEVNYVSYLGNNEEIIEKIREGAVQNLKRTFIKHFEPQDFFDEYKGEGLHWIEKFTEIKTVWIPQGG
jgi:acyl-CoA reductase-like NAD-dependent aldehyde dehydrogenase